MVDVLSFGLGSAVGALIGSAWWIWYVFKRLPLTEKHIEDRIVKRIPIIVKRSVPIIKEVIQEELPDLDKTVSAIKTEIKKEIADFKKSLPDMKAEITSMLPEMIDEVFVTLVEKVSDENNKDMNFLLNTVAARSVNVGLYLLGNDPKIKEQINGMILKRSDTAFKAVWTKIEAKLVEYGLISPQGGTPGQPSTPGQPLSPGLPQLDPAMQQKIQGAMQLMQGWKQITGGK